LHDVLVPASSKQGWQPHALCRYYSGPRLKTWHEIYPDVRVAYLDKSDHRDSDDIGLLTQRLIPHVTNN